METWNLDKTHSEIQFKVKHMVISTVTGSFTDFDGSLTLEGNQFENAKINLAIDVNSIDTRNEGHDGHLKSADFFAAETHPQMTVQVNSISKKSEEDYVLHTLINIKGTEKAVDLQANYGGVIKDPYGNQRMGIEVSGKINRQDFGLTWSAVTEAGGLVVSDEIKLIGNVELIKA